MNVVLSSSPLHLIPLLVALGSVLSLFLTRGAESSRQAGPTAARVVAASIVAALVALAISARPLFSGHRVLSHALRLARVGSLDANLSFWLDAKSATLAFGVLVLALLALLSPPARRASPASQAGLGLAVATLLVAVLGDGFPTLLTGWIGFGIVMAALVGTRSAGAGSRAFGAIVGGGLMLALGASLVFWGLGGRFLDGRRYLSDYRAPFEASSKPASDSDPNEAAGVHAPKVGEKSYLTILTRPGAKVYLGLANDSQLNARTEPFAISPVVRAELPAGLQKVTIDPGGGAMLGGDGREIALIEQVRFAPNEEVEIRALGPSLTFREIDRQLETSASSFAERQLGSIRVLDAGCLALGLAGLGLALSFGAAFRRPRRSLEKGTTDPRIIGFAGGCTAILAATIGARLSGLFAASAAVGAVVSIAALTLALLAGLRSLRAWSATSFITESASASIALVVASSASSVGAGAMALAVASALSLTAIGIILERASAGGSEGPSEADDRSIELGVGLGGKDEGRSFTLAVLALAGSPVPGAGVFVGMGAIGVAALARGGLLGVVIGVLAGAAWATLAHGTYRAYYCLSHARVAPLAQETALSQQPPKILKKSSKKSASKAEAEPRTSARIEAITKARDHWPTLMAIAACLGGPVVGVAMGVFEQPTGQTTTARVLAFVALAIPAAITGHLARTRYATGRPADWVLRDRRGVLGRLSEQPLGEAVPTDEETPRQRGTFARLAALFLGVDRLLDAPLDRVARIVARPADTRKDGA